MRKGRIRNTPWWSYNVVPAAEEVYTHVYKNGHPLRWAFQGIQLVPLVEVRVKEGTIIRPVITITDSMIFIEMLTEVSLLVPREVVDLSVSPIRREILIPSRGLPLPDPLLHPTGWEEILLNPSITSEECVHYIEEAERLYPTSASR